MRQRDPAADVYVRHCESILRAAASERSGGRDVLDANAVIQMFMQLNDEEMQRAWKRCGQDTRALCAMLRVPQVDAQRVGDFLRVRRGLAGVSRSKAFLPSPGTTHPWSAVRQQPMPPEVRAVQLDLLRELRGGTHDAWQLSPDAAWLARQVAQRGIRDVQPRDVAQALLLLGECGWRPVLDRLGRESLEQLFGLRDRALTPYLLDSMGLRVTASAPGVAPRFLRDAFRRNRRLAHPAQDQILALLAEFSARMRHRAAASVRPPSPRLLSTAARFGNFQRQSPK